MRFTRIGELLGGWPRRLLALSCLLLALLSATHASSPAARAGEPTAGVVVAARSLPIGTTITASDVRVASWPARLRPATGFAAPSDAVGQRLAGGLAAGDAVTRERLVSGDLAAGLPAGTVAAPVTLADAGAANLIRAGDYVDLISPASQNDPGAAAATGAALIALDVLVLAVTPASPDSGSAGAQLVVAVARTTELKLAQAETGPVLATVVDHP
jgi:Flp pilus assembly protein CpaB